MKAINMDTKNAEDIFSPSKETLLERKFASLELRIAELKAELNASNTEIWEAIRSIKRGYADD